MTCRGTLLYRNKLVVMQYSNSPPSRSMMSQIQPRLLLWTSNPTNKIQMFPQLSIILVLLFRHFRASSLTWSRFKTSTRFRTYCLNSAFDDSTCAAVQYCTSRSTVELFFANSITNSKFLCTIKCIQVRLMSRSYRTNISQLNSTQGCETFAIFDDRISQKIGP